MKRKDLVARRDLKEARSKGASRCTRTAELRTRGVGKNLAAQTAGSPHGPWQVANSPALAIALPNAYLASLGIPPFTVRR